MKIHARDGSFELFFNDCAAFAPREGIGPGQAINPEHLGERGISVLQVTHAFIMCVRRVVCTLLPSGAPCVVG